MLGALHQAPSRPALRRGDCPAPPALLKGRAHRRRLSVGCRSLEDVAPATTDASVEGPSSSKPSNPLANIKWPKNPVGDKLESLALTVVGTDSELNWAMCQALAKRIGWFPTFTGKVLAGMHKAASWREVADAQGWEKLVSEEADMLRGMRSQRRVAIATLGGGAAASDAVWKDLYGSLVIWVDEVDSASPPPATPERQLYAARAEIKLQLKKVRGFGSKSTTAEQRAKDSLELLMPKIKVYLDQNPDVAARKKQYMADGYRGDWPAQLPPERSPALEAFAADRKPIAAS